MCIRDRFALCQPPVIDQKSAGTKAEQRHDDKQGAKAELEPAGTGGKAHSCIVLLGAQFFLIASCPYASYSSGTGFLESYNAPHTKPASGLQCMNRENCLKCGAVLPYVRVVILR